MRFISPFDNGTYHTGTIRTNRTNRELERGFLGLQRVRNILSPPNEMHFSIRQRVVSPGPDSYESNESTTRTSVSQHRTCRKLFEVPLMRCISPFDNGSYHTGTIRTNRTNSELERGFLGLQRVRNILSPPNEMHYSIRQRV